MRAAHFPYLSVAAMAAVVVAMPLFAACGSSSATTGAASSSASPTSASSAQSAASGSSASAVATSLTIITRSQAGAALGQAVKPPVLGHATVEGGVAAVFYGPNAPADASADVPVNDSVRAVLVTGPHALKYFNDYRSKVKAQAIAGLATRPTTTVMRRSAC